MSRIISVTRAVSATRMPRSVLLHHDLSLLWPAVLTGCVAAASTAMLFAPALAGDPAEAAAGTHKQVRLIQVAAAGGAERLTTFAVDHDGRVLAGVAGTASAIRVYDADGQRTADWPLPVPPEAVNVGPNGKVFVGGQGKLLRLDATGRIEQEAAAPNMTNAKEAATQIHGRVQKQIERDLSVKLQSKLRTYQQRLAEVEKKLATVDRDILALEKEVLKEADPNEDLKAAAKQLRAKRASYLRMQSSLEKFIATTTSQQPSQQPSQKRPSAAPADDRENERQIQQLVAAQMKLASISASKKEVFFACSSSAGHGFDVWRINHDFADAKKIGESLRGCCGQMDVQANDNGIYVAENTRHRVRCFNRNGGPVLEFGTRARDGGEGFEGCCNPMNVAFGPEQSVYTAEAGSGRVLRFAQDGSFMHAVGAVELVPGCKKVSIAVSPDGGRVYMLDITRGHIVVMESRDQSQRPAGDPLSMR